MLATVTAILWAYGIVAVLFCTSIMLACLAYEIFITARVKRDQLHTAAAPNEEVSK